MTTAIGIMSSLHGAARVVVTLLPRLTAVPALRPSFPSPRTLGGLRTACSAATAPQQPRGGAQLVSGGRRQAPGLGRRRGAACRICTAAAPCMAPAS